MTNSNVLEKVNSVSLLTLRRHYFLSTQAHPTTFIFSHLFVASLRVTFQYIVAKKQPWSRVSQLGSQVLATLLHHSVCTPSRRGLQCSTLVDPCWNTRPLTESILNWNSYNVLISRVLAVEVNIKSGVLLTPIIKRTSRFLPPLLVIILLSRAVMKLVLLRTWHYSHFCNRPLELAQLS